jgi:hypothetical protein
VINRNATATASVWISATFVTPTVARTLAINRAMVGSPSQPIATPMDVIASWIAER